MKIVTIVRTRNEERNIARFCRAYSFSDSILIADGGSDDKTIAIARTFPNVEVRHYTEKVFGQNDIWRNPEGRHINFLIDWAKEVGSDWTIFDDCDSFPVIGLQKIARTLFEGIDKTNKIGIRAHHIYMYGKDMWFPQMNKNIGFIWAWRTRCKIHADNKEDWGIIYLDFPVHDECFPVEYPYALLHDYCPDVETVERKLNFYNGSGKMSHTVHPLDICGELAPLEFWMKD